MAVLYTGDSNFTYEVPRIKTEDFLIEMYNAIKKDGINYEVSDTFIKLKNNNYCR